MTGELYRRLQKSYEPLQYEIIENATLEQLHRALAAQPYDIVHISGYGGQSAPRRPGAGPAREDGRPVLIERDQLAELLDRKEIRLICLDACHSDLLAYGLAKDLRTPAIYGIQSIISTEAADTFAEGFLAAVLAGQPLTACVTQGRQSIDVWRPGSREWALPVLYTDSPDGQLVLAPWQTGAEAAVKRDLGLERAAQQDVPAPESPERQKLQMWIALKRRNLDVLESQSAGANYVSVQLSGQIADLRGEIADLEQKLSVTP